MEAGSENLRKVEDQEVEQVSGGGYENYPDAPLKWCPYCLKEWGGGYIMDCVGRWSHFENDVWTSGYAYRCPGCNRKAQFEV